MRLLVALILLALSVSMLAWVGAEWSDEYVVDGNVNVDRAIAHWKNVIDEFGPESAKTIAAEEIRRQNTKNQHELAHTYGAALYEKGGIPYAAFCTEGFIFGCLHQFIGLAIAEHGVAILGDLREKCRSLGTGDASCAHAAGHALVSHHGYETAGLEGTLGACARLAPNQAEVFYCRDGAFMEYNLRSMIAEDRSSLRTFDPQSPREPCESIGAGERECAFQLPLWWQAVLSGNSVYTDMGDLCRDFGDTALAMSCFAGIGFASTWFENFSAEKVGGACAAAAQGSAQIAACRAGAAHNAKVNRLSFEAFCELTPEEKEFCLAFASESRYKALHLRPPGSFLH
jgi:hypothetical protein